MPLFPKRNRNLLSFLARFGRFHLARRRALGAALGCCLLVACGQDAAEKAPPHIPSPEPQGLFSRRAPEMPAPPAPVSRRMLVVGDSLSISLGEQLERTLAGVAGIDFSRDGTRSSGLTRPELVNWPEHLRELVSPYAPDLVVIMLGANDVMPVAGPDGSHVYFNDPNWAKAYTAKAQELVTICRQVNAKASIYWVGVPPMGSASLGTSTRQVNAVLRAMCRTTAGCRFIDTEEAFSDSSDRFTRHARDVTGDIVSIRTADGVHLTESGARLLAGVVLETLTRQESLPASAGVGELLAAARDLRPVPDGEAPAEAAGPAQPKAAPMPPKAMPSNKVYEVRNGDTLRIIAKRLGVDPKALEDVNPGVDSRRLSLGQRLRIPARP